MTKRYMLMAAVSIGFGALYFGIQELAQSSLFALAGDTLDFERCSNYLYDSAEPLFSLCAAIACFVSLSRLRRYATGVKLAASTFITCLLCFQPYAVWMAFKVMARQEWTALYSPGIWKRPTLLVYALSGIELEIETFFWASVCAVLLMPLLMGVRVGSGLVE